MQPNKLDFFIDIETFAKNDEGEHEPICVGVIASLE